MTSRRRSHNIVKNGWVTDQHGSWAMGFVPLILGLWSAPTLTWLHGMLCIAWTSGFFFFAVAEKWLKFRYKPRYRPALITYGAIAAIFSLILIIGAPHLLWWGLVYLPLIVASFYLSWAKKERSLLARLVAIAAACLVLPLAINVDIPHPWFAADAIAPKGWYLCALLTTYFATTVPFVKTVIRERNSTPWFIGSITVHVVVVLAMAALAVQGYNYWTHVLVWVLLTGRAVAMPLLAKRRGVPWRPRNIGMPEIGYSLLVFATLPYGLAFP